MYGCVTRSGFLSLWANIFYSILYVLFHTYLRTIQNIYAIDNDTTLGKELFCEVNYVTAIPYSPGIRPT